MAKAALKAAPAPEPEEQEAAAAPKVRKKKKKGGKLVLIILLVALLGGGGGAAWFFTRKPHTAEEAKKAAEKPPVFVNLDTFTVNLQQETGDQYLQVTLNVKATDDAVDPAIKLHMPEIRNRLLLLLSSKKPSELLTVPGKEQLAREILLEVRKPLPQELQEQVAAVYFTSFVIQ